MYEIKTSNYVQSKKILIDDKEWTMSAPGAGDELVLGQAKRRAELVQKKIDAGTAVDEDYNTYDRLENKMFEVFSKIFQDKTEDNSEVKGWLDSTPMVVIYAIVEDIKKQAEAKDGTQVS